MFLQPPSTVLKLSITPLAQPPNIVEKLQVDIPVVVIVFLAPPPMKEHN